MQSLKYSYAQDLNVRAKTVTHLEELTGVNLHDLELGDGVLYMSYNVQATKEKTKFCASENAIKISKNIPPELEENICILFIWKESAKFCISTSKI